LQTARRDDVVKALNAKADRAELEERVELLKTAGNILHFTTHFTTYKTSTLENGSQATDG
jgi:hypothetical protein